MNRIFASLWFLGIALTACRTTPRGASSNAIRPILLKALPGEVTAAYQCGAEGWRCKPLANEDSVGPGRLLKTTVGGRAGFEIDAATTFELGGDAEVLISDERTLEAHRGSVMVRQLGGKSAAGSAGGFRLRVARRTAEVDARFGADFSVRARDEEHGTLTVERGRITLQGAGGEATVVLSGETVSLTPGKPPERIASPLTLPRPPSLVLAENRPLHRSTAERGLGTMTARVPGQTAVVSGVELVSHHVEVAVRDGFARTEIDEVFRNDTSQVLEGRYVFPLPTDASISRLTLWVGDKPVEGEIVEKKRAATIFHSIVEDTVRPRDPALLEWVAGGDFSLKVFPLPAKGTRRVRIAYDQALPESGGRVHYAYPLGVGTERSTPVADFSIHLSATDSRAKIDDPEVSGLPASLKRSGGEIQLEYRASALRPTEDFVLTYARPHDDQAELSVYVPGWGDPKKLGLDGAALGAEGAPYFALKFAPQIPASGLDLAQPQKDRAFLVDKSHGQSADTLESAIRIVLGLVRQMDPDERFAVLACDSGCVSYPESGLVPGGDTGSVQGLERWAEGINPSGSSDVAGALIAGLAKLEEGGLRSKTGSSWAQVVYLGDGAPSSGELSADTIAARWQGALAGRAIDTRLFGLGRAVDDMTLASLAGQIGATFESVQTGGSLDQRIADLAVTLRSPVVANPRIELPNGFTDVYPASLPNLRLGQQVVLVGRTQAGQISGQSPGEVRVRGTVAGQPYTFAFPIQQTRDASQQNPLVPRLWAQARIEALEARNDANSLPVILDISKRYHVMSRYTSLLVLENDAMYSEFGIRRTAAPGGLSDLAAPLASALPVPEPTAASPSLPPPPQPVPETGLARRARMADPASDAELRAKEESAEPPPAAAAPKAAQAYASPPPTPQKPARAEEAPAAAPPGAAPPEPALAPAPTGFAEPPPEARESRPSGRDDVAPIDGENSDARERKKRPASSFGSAGAPSTAGLSGRGDMELPSSGPFGVGTEPWQPEVREAGAVEVYGALSAEAVRQSARIGVARMRSCYREGLARSPSLTGTLILAFTVDTAGTVIGPYIAGGTLADASVRTCVVRTLLGVVFPSSGGGATSVRYPISFQLQGARTARTDVYRPRPVPVGPTATHSPATDAWMAQGEEALVRLRAALDHSPESRKRFEELVRGLLANGRFGEALATAQRFANLDPDSSIAQELLSYAAVANGNPRLAVASVDNQTETDPKSAKWHTRAARAFEAIYDERRACAHWRSLAEIKPNVEEFVYQALRCRARVLGDRGRALSEARTFARPGRLMTELIRRLESGAGEAYDRGSGTAGALEVEVMCPASPASGNGAPLGGTPWDLRCPAPFVIAPNGTVFSPFTPTDARSGARVVALSRVHEGTYRTVVVSGGGESDAATLTIRALSATRTFKLAPAPASAAARSVAATRIAQPPARLLEIGAPAALAFDY